MYVASGDKCQQSSAKPQKQPGKLHQIEMDPQMWKQVGNVLIGPPHGDCPDSFHERIEPHQQFGTSSGLYQVL